MTDQEKKQNENGLRNQIMLITYPDCMGRDLKDLKEVLSGELKGLFGGVHILPFFPSSGDRGFSPVTYREVDERFGTWEDIEDIAAQYDLMIDFMINHISVQSAEYRDFLEKKDDSRYRDFFIRFKDFYPEGEPTEEEDAAIYRRRIGKGTYITAHFKDGTKEKVWCTFSDEQVDINCERSAEAKHFVADNLKFLAGKGAKLIRLDAFAYATKKRGTNCFFVEPQVYDLIGMCREALSESSAHILPEIHEHYFIQKKLSERDYYVYDFQLPMLLLNALQTGRTLYLKNWLTVCSDRQYTTLDTHDGIGVVDARYLMPDDELQETKMRIYEQNPGTAKIFSSIAGVLDKSFNTYQINCTYYSALGEDDDKYLLSRAVQFFAPGIPQVYYVGLFAGKNDFDLYEETKEARAVNRHYYTREEIRKEAERPVVKKLFELMRLRNTHPAFDGSFCLKQSDAHTLVIRRENGAHFAELTADFANATYHITCS